MVTRLSSMLRTIRNLIDLQKRVIVIAPRGGLLLVFHEGNHSEKGCGSEKVPYARRARC